MPVFEHPDEVELRANDVLIFATKTQDLPGLLEQWAWRRVADGSTRPPVAATTIPVLTVQNGLEAERLALRYFDDVIGAVTLIAARHVDPGVVEALNEPRIGQLILGRFPRKAPTTPVRPLEPIIEDLREAQWVTREVSNIFAWKVWKLLMSSTFGVSVLAGGAEELDAARQAINAETRAVLAAAGLEIAESEAVLAENRHLLAFRKESGELPNQDSTKQVSTWQSFARKNTTGQEGDYLNGEVVLLGRLHGVETPLNSALQRILGTSFIQDTPPGTVPVQALYQHRASHQH